MSCCICHRSTDRSDTYHVTFVHLGAHGHLDDEPGGVPQDEGGDEVPVDDVSQAADAPVRKKKTEEDKLVCLRCLYFFYHICPAVCLGK